MMIKMRAWLPVFMETEEFLTWLGIVKRRRAWLHRPFGCKTQRPMCYTLLFSSVILHRCASNSSLSLSFSLSVSLSL